MSSVTENNSNGKTIMEKAAAVYAERFRWKVFPTYGISNGRCTCGRNSCQSPGKHPLVPKGVHDATDNLDVISRWWARWPNANVAIATGSSSGFFVLDVDGQTGEDSLCELEAEHGPLASTIEAITGGGGRHILFKCAELVSNKVALAPGLDIRGDCGYVVAPPSLHISGHKYQWEVSSRPGEVPLAIAPEWLIGLLKPQGMSRGVEDWRIFIRQGVKTGERNSAVASLAGMLLRKFVDPYVVLDLCIAWNRAKCKPPLNDDEVAATVDSVARLEARRREVTG